MSYKLKSKLSLNVKLPDDDVIKFPELYPVKLAESIDLSNIDLIILDFDNTIIEEGFLEYCDDFEKKEKLCRRINTFLNNLLKLGKFVCICTGANYAESFAEYSESIGENTVKMFKEDMDLLEYVPIFGLWSFQEVTLDDRFQSFDDCPIRGGHSSKNEIINNILNVYSPLLSRNSSFVDFSIPSRSLYIDDQLGLIRAAQKAFGVNVIQGLTSSKDDIVTLFDSLIPKGSEYRCVVFDGIDV